MLMSQKSELMKQCRQDAKGNDGNMQVLSEQSLDSSVKMVQASSLLKAQDEKTLGGLLAVFAKYDEKTFLIPTAAFKCDQSSTSMIPSSTELMRDESQELVGMSVITGG